MSEAVSFLIRRFQNIDLYRVVDDAQQLIRIGKRCCYTLLPLKQLLVTHFLGSPCQSLGPNLNVNTD